MGQQQLLLLVVGIIIVAVAVVVGINQFGSTADQGELDNMISAMNQIKTQALAYYEKPTDWGGGNKTFTGFVADPKLLVLANTYTMTSVPTATDVTLSGSTAGGLSKTLVVIPIP